MSGIMDLIGIVGKYAPLLGSVLGIPGAGAIVQAVAAAFGGDANKPQELAAKIEKNPAEAQVKLAEIQSNMKVQLEQIAATNLQNQLLAEKARMENETAQLESDRLDRISARKLGEVSYMPSIVSFIILIGFFLVIYLIMFRQITNQDSNVLFLLFGTVSSAFASTVAYWLGSSAGSKQKDNLLVQQAVTSDFKTKTMLEAAATAEARVLSNPMKENSNLMKENTDALLNNTNEMKKK